MRTFILAAACSLFVSAEASAHTFFVDNYAPAGYTQILTMLVPHGCKGSPVKEVHLKIPETVSGVSVANNRDWSIEIKKRKLDQPINGEGGAKITETTDEIVWKNPRTPPVAGLYDSFELRVSLPKTVGAVLWFKEYNVCDQGDDKYTDVPKETLSADMPDFAQKLGAFVHAVPGPAPYVVLTKPARPQYPWEAAEPAKPAAK